MIRDGILLLDHYRVGMERLIKITHEDLIPQAARSMPIYWKPSRAAVAGHQQPILWPGYSEKLDYEFELGLYIGKRGKNIPVERAWEHVAGYTVFNDLGLRDHAPTHSPCDCQTYVQSRTNRNALERCGHSTNRQRSVSSIETLGIERQSAIQLGS